MSRSDFPIPRLRAIPNPKPAIQPTYDPQPTPFAPDLFQLFFSLVNYHLPAYDLGQNTQYSPAVEVVSTAVDGETTAVPIMHEHIFRKFLLEVHQQFLALTSKPVLSKIAKLHSELFLTSEVMPSTTPPALVQYCQMLMAEAYDLFNSVVTKTVSEDFWGKKKTVEEVINEFLKKEIEKIRIVNNHSFESLALCAIRRAVENAPGDGRQKIMTWAKDNSIPYDPQ